jgi:hypothetical protein
MLFSKNSFKTKVKQDFSELLNFLDSSSERINSSPNVSNKYLTFGEKLNFEVGKKRTKKTFNVPYFDDYRDVNPRLLLAYYFGIYFYYRNVFVFFRIFVFFFFIILIILFFNSSYCKFISSIYTFYFIDIIYNVEDFFQFFKNIFNR